MKAIKTVYHGATTNLSSRITATAEGGHRVTIPYPHEFGEGMDSHAQAALALCKKLGWTGTLHGGGLPDCYVFVFAPTRPDSYGAYKIA